MIILENGLQKSDFYVYEQFLNKFDHEKFTQLSKNKQNYVINIMNEKLRSLYGITKKYRDKYLKEEHGRSYRECFEKNIEVRMPINTRIFSLQEEYYNFIKKLYDIRDKDIL